jgi:anti-sigma regulatory factor (Ser/Thr protein kinase)
MHPEQPGRHLRIFEAKIGNLPEVSSYIEACAGNAGIPPARRMKILLALEEAFVNISSYAYDTGDGQVRVECQDTAEEFVLELSDEGKPFDQRSLPEPNLLAGIDHRPIGGLGGLLLRKLTDRTGYRREIGRNILTLAFRKAAETDCPGNS